MLTREEEKAFLDGQRSVWSSILAQAVRELQLGAPERALVQLEDTRTALSALFRKLGLEPDWDGRLHLVDWVEHLSKELSDHVRAKAALDEYERLCKAGSVQIFNLGDQEVVVDFLPTGQPEKFRSFGRDLQASLEDLQGKLTRAGI